MVGMARERSIDHRKADRPRGARGLMAGILSGLTAGVAVYKSHSYACPDQSTEAGLHGDWVRIGGDFEAAIGRVRVEAEA